MSKIFRVGPGKRQKQMFATETKKQKRTQIALGNQLNAAIREDLLIKQVGKVPGVVGGSPLQRLKRKHGAACKTTGKKQKQLSANTFSVSICA
jgi:hypothetical protein